MTHEQAAEVVAEWMGWLWSSFSEAWIHPGGGSITSPTREIERKLAENNGTITDYTLNLMDLFGVNPSMRRNIAYALMTATDEQRVLAAAQTIEAMGGGDQ
jgi:hypothetical protein